MRDAVEGDGADDVRAAGLVALGRRGPGDLVEADEVDGAAAAVLGRAAPEAVAAGDQGAGAEGA